MPTKKYYTIRGDIYGEEDFGAVAFLGYAEDALGSVIASTDLTGKVQNAYRYKPYGAMLATVGATPNPMFTWLGRLGYRSTNRTWSESYIRSRHFSSSSAAFTTKAGRREMMRGEQAYAYGFGAPTVYTDFFGRMATTNCSAGVSHWLNKICNNMKNLTPQRIDRINRQMGIASYRVGQPCPPLTQSIVDSFNDFCSHGDVTCYPEGGIPGEPTAAGLTHTTHWWQGPVRQIDLTIGPNGGSPLVCPGGLSGLDYFQPIREPGTGVRLDWLAQTFIHELGHAAGVDHGHEGPNYHTQCNDIYSFFIYNDSWGARAR